MFQARFMRVEPHISLFLERIENQHNVCASRPVNILMQPNNGLSCQLELLPQEAFTWDSNEQKLARRNAGKLFVKVSGECACFCYFVVLVERHTSELLPHTCPNPLNVFPDLNTSYQQKRSSPENENNRQEEY